VTRGRCAAWVFAVVTTLSAGTHLRPDRPLAQQLLVGFALAAMLLLYTLVWQVGSALPMVSVTLVVAISLACPGLADVGAVTGLCAASTVLLSFYGSRRFAWTQLILMAGTLVLSLTLSSIAGERAIPSTEMLTAGLPHVLLLGALSRGTLVLLLSREVAVLRERVLTRTAGLLLRGEPPASAARVVAHAAASLTTGYGVVSARVLRPDGNGRLADLDLDLTPGSSIVLDLASSAVTQAAMADRLQPIPVRSDSRSAKAETSWHGMRFGAAATPSYLVVASTGTLPDPVIESLETLAGLWSLARAREQARAELEHQAYQDELTQLANRALLFQRLDKALRRFRTLGGHPPILMLIDLDDFKQANDPHGHALGDRVLRGVARGWSRSARRGICRHASAATSSPCY
jgi:hypothetical protein